MADVNGKPLAKCPKGYEPIRCLGQGAGSTIYLVYDRDTGEKYALKYVEVRKDRDKRFVQQLFNEFEIGRKVTDAGIRRAFRFKANHKQLELATAATLALDPIIGEPLHEHVPRSRARLLDNFIEVARAVDGLNKLGYVHCDLKPSNVIIDVDGIARVIDLGQACPLMTQKERIQGTDGYIAPEQARREAVTARTDVFNFGATLYWALSGNTVASIEEILQKIGAASPTPPKLTNSTVPKDLSDLTMECLRFDPYERPETLAIVADRLQLIREAIPEKPKSGVRFRGKSGVRVRGDVDASEKSRKPGEDNRSSNGTPVKDPPPGDRSEGAGTAKKPTQSEPPWKDRPALIPVIGAAALAAGLAAVLIIWSLSGAGNPPPAAPATAPAAASQPTTSVGQ